MFWTVIRWGGTVAVIVLVIAAAVMATQPEAEGPTVIPAQPGEAAPQPAKNFNL